MCGRASAVLFNPIASLGATISYTATALVAPAKFSFNIRIVYRVRAIVVSDGRVRSQYLHRARASLEITVKKKKTVQRARRVHEGRRCPTPQHRHGRQRLGHHSR